MGLFMVDTGAAFTMVTRSSTDYHGLPITAQKSMFRQADSSLGNIIGVVDFTMQVHDHLEMELREVAVQEGTFYHALLGQDVLAGDSVHLGQTRVVLGDCLDWVNLKEKGVIYPTPLR